MSNTFLANLAESNIRLRNKRFSGEIAASVVNSKRYTLTDIRRNAIDISSCGEREYPTTLTVTDQSIRYHMMVMIRHMAGMKGKTAILNPANYLIAGGGYVDGDFGYEEEMCANTTLFEVLSKCSDYYEWNNQHVNNGLYTNVCLYTPNIIVCDNGNKHIGVIDVITCSAPNYDAVSVKKANKAVHDRIELIFNVAARNNVENLILCGFGCDFSRSDVEYIASMFYEMYIFYSSRFNSVSFVMGSENKHVKTFEKAFGMDS